MDSIDRDFEKKALELFEVEKERDAAIEAKQPEDTINQLTEKVNHLDEELEEIANVADDFGIVLPVSEIASINIFSEYIHSIYFQPKNPARLLLPE